MTTEKVVLSNPVEFELRGGVVLKVYPASLEVISQLDSKIKKLEKMGEESSLKAQADAFAEVVYELVKEDNDVKKVDLKKFLTIEACTKILQTAVGSLRV